MLAVETKTAFRKPVYKMGALPRIRKVPFRSFEM